MTLAYYWQSIIRGQAKFSIPDDFGGLHGKLFQSFVNSDAYKQNFNKPPVICLSVSDNKTYHRIEISILY